MTRPRRHEDDPKDPDRPDAETAATEAGDESTRFRSGHRGNADRVRDSIAKRREDDQTSD